MKGLLPAIAVALLACGAVHGAAPQPNPPSPPTAALAKWSSFPANRVPRPIVFLGVLSQYGGFETNDGKIAWTCGKYVLGISLPSQVPAYASATWVDGTTASYPAISAAAAFDALRTDPTRSTSPDCASAQPLVVTSVRLGTSAFETDRGAAQMTSWVFAVRGATGEMGYPALSLAAFWRQGLSIASGVANGSVVLGAQGTSFAYRIAGPPPTGLAARPTPGRSLSPTPRWRWRCRPLPTSRRARSPAPRSPSSARSPWSSTARWAGGCW